MLLKEEEEERVKLSHDLEALEEKFLETEMTAKTRREEAEARLQAFRQDITQRLIVRSFAIDGFE